MKFIKLTLLFIAISFFQNSVFAQTSTKATTKTSPKTEAPKKKVPMLEVDINSVELKQLKTDYPEITIIDVRTKAEVAQGMIPGAMHIEWGSKEFNEKIGKLDQSKPYIVYCAVGGRSVNAQRLMKFNGFVNVANLKGGYKEYAKSK
ncbi:MAG TPA: rhodanese-like domain-containing protein [Saprospiraceae bacterium]|nr:rhodanese-like domain-containing protein [Saprospiraceae bacterium]